tara:strand:+ start:898 stop:1110 length:213 start_codon:yes stop_codon:yes gene_type:complete
MQIGDLVRFKQDPDAPFGLPPKDLKVVLDLATERQIGASRWVIVYYLEGQRAGQKSPCDIDMLEVISESR